MICKNKICFNYNSNEPLTNDSIPNNTTHLFFGDLFNQPVDNYIPEGILHITFGWMFNQSIENIPKSVISLTLGWNYGLKNEVYNFTIANSGYYNLDCVLPTSINSLSFKNSSRASRVITQYPNQLISLRFGNEEVEEIHMLEPEAISVEQILSHVVNLNVLTTEEIEEYIIEKQQFYKDINKKYLKITEKSFLNPIIPQSILNNVKIIEIKNNVLYKINEINLKTNLVIYHSHHTNAYNKLQYKFKNFKAKYDSHETLLTHYRTSLFSEELTKVVFNPERIMIKATQNNMSFEEYYENL